MLLANHFLRRDDSIGFMPASLQRSRMSSQLASQRSSTHLTPLSRNGAMNSESRSFIKTWMRSKPGAMPQPYFTIYVKTSPIGQRPRKLQKNMALASLDCHKMRINQEARKAVRRVCQTPLCQHKVNCHYDRQSDFMVSTRFQLIKVGVYVGHKMTAKNKSQLLIRNYNANINLVFSWS